jgi:NADH dehydrogenase
MKNMMVLGGSGFVGAHICEKLVREGWSVTVPTRRRNNARNVMHLPGLTVLELNVHDEAALTAALSGHDAVINCIAILHGTQAEFERTHVDLPQKLVRASAANGVKQLVHLSALGVNASQPGAAPSLYLRSKGQGEQALAHACTHGTQVAILRPSVIFGHGDKFLNLFARLQKVAPFMPLAGAQARFQPVWVEDVAAASVQCLALHRNHSRQPQVFEACGPEVFTLRQLVQIAARLAGVNEGRGRPVIGLPHWAATLQALVMEHLPGPTLMSRDNLASMQVDNVATPGMPGLDALGIRAAALEGVAQVYLNEGRATQGLLGIRKHPH